MSLFNNKIKKLAEEKHSTLSLTNGRLEDLGLNSIVKAVDIEPIPGDKKYPVKVKFEVLTTKETFYYDIPNDIDFDDMPRELVGWLIYDLSACGYYKCTPNKPKYSIAKYLETGGRGPRVMITSMDNI